MKKSWFKRFERAISDSGKSLREISLAAGVRPGYLHDVFKKEQDPGVSRFLSICDAAGISPLYVLTGIEATPSVQKIEKIFTQLDDDQQEAFLSLLEKFQR